MSRKPPLAENRLQANLAYCLDQAAKPLNDAATWTRLLNQHYPQSDYEDLAERVNGLRWRLHNLQKQLQQGDTE